jgi:hypothetical protein
MLKLSAAAAPVFMTLKPSAALAATSVVTCHVNLSSTDTRSQYVDRFGNLVPAKTEGAFPPLNGSSAVPGTPYTAVRTGGYAAYTGEEIRAFERTGALPNSGEGRFMSSNLNEQRAQMQAHMNYMKKLGSGQGLTCMLSVNGA